MIFFGAQNLNCWAKVAILAKVSVYGQHFNSKITILEFGQIDRPKFRFFWMNLVKHFNLATENWSNIPGQTFRFLTKKSDYTTAILNSKLWAQSGHHVSGQVIISVVAVWPMGNWPPYGDYDLVGNFQLLFLIGQHVTLILKYLLRPKYFQFRRHYTQWRRFFRTDSQIWEDGNCSVRNLDFVA